MTTDPAPFIDAHHHLWEPQTLEYSWLRDIGAPKPFGDPTPIQRDYIKDEFWAEASACGVVASVHVQADGALPDPVSESRWIAEQAARDPGAGQPGKWVGFVNLLGEDAQAVLEAHAAVPGFAGIRHIVARTATAPKLSFVPSELMQDSRWQRNFGLLAGLGARFDLQLYPDQVDDAVALISQHEDTTIIVDHCAGPYFLLEAHRRNAIPAAEPELAHWAEGVWRLSRLPNVSIKLSGLGMYHPHWSAQNCRVIFQTILDAFGPERVMLGSNFPVDKLFKTYAEVVGIWDEWLSPLSADEQHNVRVGAASRAYGLADRSQAVLTVLRETADG